MKKQIGLRSYKVYQFKKQNRFIFEKYNISRNGHYICVKCNVSSCGYVVDNQLQQRNEARNGKKYHQDWFNKDPWDNTSICLRLHGSLFEYFITHARNDRYNLMCSLVALDKIQPAYEYDESSIGDWSITKNTSIEALVSLVSTLNYIDKCLKLFEDYYDTRCVAYITVMKDMFKQIPQTMSKPLNTKKMSRNL